MTKIIDELLKKHLKKHNLEYGEADGGRYHDVPYYSIAVDRDDRQTVEKILRCILLEHGRSTIQRCIEACEKVEHEYAGDDGASVCIEALRNLP